MGFKPPPMTIPYNPPTVTTGVTMAKSSLSGDVWVERWDVVGTSGKPYVVAKHRNGTFGCSCEAWTNQKKHKWVYDPVLHMNVRQDCQHILKIKLGLLQQTGQAAVNNKQQKVKAYEDLEVEREIEL